MANSSHIPSGNLHDVRPGFSQESVNGRFRSVAPETTGHHAESPAPATSSATSINGNLIGPRKLIRPRLPESTLRDRSFASRSESPMLTHQRAMVPRDSRADSNAECFYFQKQVQTQTLMVFVLEDGDQVEGYIEWYDINAIKIKNGSRTLIYKSAIKYLYKAGDVQGSLDGSRRGR